MSGEPLPGAEIGWFSQDRPAGQRLRFRNIVVEIALDNREQNQCLSGVRIDFNRLLECGQGFWQLVKNIMDITTVRVLRGATA